MSLLRAGRRPTDSEWRRYEEVIDRFEVAWRSEDRPRVRDYLPPEGDSGRGHLLGELIKIDLEYGWQRGQGRLVEEYLAEFPELKEDARLSGELIGEECRVRFQVGRPSSAEELRRRFPDQGPEAGSLSRWLRRPGDTPRDQVTPSWGAEAQPGAAPARLGRYEIREQVGRGGFATVYRAWDPDLKRTVAVKVSRADHLNEAWQARLLREARSAAQLHHPAIVPIHEIGEHNGCQYIVYEYVPGPTLADWIKQTRPKPEQAARWAMRLAEALDYAHQCGVIHRDVKPANVMLNRDGEPMLADFGLALHAAEGATLLTHEGDILGTPAYMSPEQARGQGHEADARSDVYSLGAVLYEMLCGRPPFEGSPASILHKVQHVDPAPPRRLCAEVGSDLETVCLKALAKEPDRRYVSAAALAEDLRRYLDHEPVLARRLGPVGRLGLWCRRKPALAATIAVAIGCLAALGAFSFWRIAEERDRYRSERASAIRNLYESLVREARAIRLARASGYRAQAWNRLHQASLLDTPARDLASLRQEAVACMGDFVGLPPVIWGSPGVNHYYVASTLSPDGAALAIGLTSGWIELADPDTGAVKTRWRAHDAGVFGLSFDRSGEVLASADDAGGVKAWKRQADASWRELAAFAIEASQKPNHVGAATVALSPDGRWLLAAAKGSRSVRIWSLPDGQPVGELLSLAHGPVLRFSLSRDGNHAVVAHRGGPGEIVTLWSVPDRKLLKAVQPEMGLTMDVIHGHQDRVVAVAGSDGVELLDAATLDKRLFIRGDLPYAVDFSPDDQVVAVPALFFGAVRLWNTISNRELAVLRHPGEPHAVHFSPSGHRLLSVSPHLVSVWNLRGSGEKMSFSGHVGGTACLAFRRDGTLLASGGRDGTVRLWDPVQGALLAELPLPNKIAGGLAISPKGDLLVACDTVGQVRFWNIQDPRAPREWRNLATNLKETTNALAISQDGGFLAVGGGRGVMLFQMHRHGPNELTRIEDAGRYEGDHGEECNHVAMSPLGSRLAWCDSSGSVYDWDWLANRRRRLKLNAGAPQGAAFFPDGRRLVVIDDARDAQIWDAGEDRVVKSLGRINPERDSNWFLGRSLSLTADGDKLAVQGTAVTIWTIEPPGLLLTLPREPNTPMCLEWSQDGNLLAIGSADGGIAVWNLQVARNQLTGIGLGW